MNHRFANQVNVSHQILADCCDLIDPSNATINHSVITEAVGLLIVVCVLECRRRHVLKHNVKISQKNGVFCNG